MYVVIIKTNRGIYFLYEDNKLGELLNDAKRFSTKKQAEEDACFYDDYMIEPI